MSQVERTPTEIAPDERERWWREAGRPQLRQLLFWRWDPIGVRDDFPWTSDEYDGHSDPIGALLGQGGGVEEVAAYLHRVEEDAMGLGRGDDAECRRAALAIVAWQRSSIAHWLAH